jgi:plasmid stabilization system protein ParE
VRRVFSAIELAADFPLAGSIVPEYQNPSLRERIVGKYRIVYRLGDNLIEVVRIAHASRLLPPL